MSDFAPVFVQGTDLGDTWFQLLRETFDKGIKYKITEGSHAGEHRLSPVFSTGFIKFPHNRPLAPIIPESSPLPPPTTDYDIEQYFANYLMDSDLEPNEDYRYATWIVGGDYQIPKIELMSNQRGMYGFWQEKEDVGIAVPNQIEWIIRHFKEKGHGNAHCYLQVGYPESNFAYDMPYNHETERRTSPCLRGLDFGIKGNMLTTNVIYRSWDLVGGFPENMGGFTLLNEYVAQEVGVEPGPLSFSCKDLHCYSHAWEYVKNRLGG